MTDAPIPASHHLARTIARTVASLAVLAVFAYVLLLATYFKAVECDDGCAEDYTGNAVYGIQFWVAVGAALLALVAVLGGYGRRTTVYYGSACAAAFGLVAWLALILGRG